MKKLSLAAIALFFKTIMASGQLLSPADSTTNYASRKLHIDEINLVSSYYQQNGDNSAVTGGIGSEHLTDIANSIDLRVIRQDKHKRQQALDIELGVDAYTSASSDKIDPATISSASSHDKRIYPSVGYSITDPVKGTTIGLVGSYSTEFDYQSRGLGLNLAKASKNNNRELALHLQAYWDTWKVILPVELRTGMGPLQHRDESSSPRNSYSASWTYTQVMSTRLQAALLLDGIYQNGLLATKYQRVYFTDHSEAAETLPDKRFKLPIGIRLHYFAGSRVILRAYYRYYTDDWGIHAHTASLEMPVKISPYVSLSPFYRYYVQTAADYFAPIYQHAITDNYFTSDYDLSAFHSHFFGVNFRYVPQQGVFGIRHLRTLELRYGHYIRSNSLTSNVVTLNIQYK